MDRRIKNKLICRNNRRRSVEHKKHNKISQQQKEHKTHIYCYLDASRNRIPPPSRGLPRDIRARRHLRAHVVVLRRLGELAELLPAGGPRRGLLGGLGELVELLLHGFHVGLEFKVLGLDCVELELEGVDVLLGGGPPLLKRLRRSF